MKYDLDQLEHQSVSLLKRSCTPHGIVACPADRDNYRRVWARDSMIAGIAGLLAGDETVIRGLSDSILTLAKYQHAHGLIPSNVMPGGNTKISYGTLAGRVDANTWFIIGSCLYLLNFPDGSLLNKLQPKIEQIWELLDRWEYNANGLLYTPMSGNWADEYPVEGYTLYDNLLRLWGLQLYNKLFEDTERQQQEEFIREKIKVNFWPRLSQTDHTAVYHQRCFEEIAESTPDHFACCIHPKGYDMHFDTAGHSLALMLGLASAEQVEAILRYIREVFRQVSTDLLPAFWPVITSDEPKWDILKNNYNFTFKNYPHHYQNGGIWPVWMGWFGLGASTTGRSELAETMLNAWMDIENPDEISFMEYIESDTLKSAGQQHLSYSASGLIFLVSAIKQRSLEKLHIQ